MKPWQHLTLSPETAAVPAMLSKEERQYLSWVTAETYTGRGAIVDLGPWLGGSSSALAEGLRRNANQGVIHCRDLFSWTRSYMPAHLDYDLPEGADFMPLFHEQTAHCSDLLDAQQMDLLDGSWDGGPIEILFVDAAKSWDLLNAILEVFGPHLIPGVTRVIHQDFRHFPTYFIPLVFDSRPDQWEEVEATDEGCTVTFRLRTDFDGSGLPYDEKDFPFETARPLLQKRIDGASGPFRQEFQLALLVKAQVEGATTEASSLRQQILDEGRDDRTSTERRLAEAAVRTTQAVTRLALQQLREGETIDSLLAHWAPRLPSDKDDAALRESLLVDRARLLLERARTRLGTKDYDAVHVDTLEALSGLQPDGPYVHAAFSVLAESWMAEQDGGRAQKVLQDLESQWSESGDFQVLKALVAHQSGSHDDARTALQRALELKPGHEDALRLRALWD